MYAYDRTSINVYSCVINIHSTHRCDMYSLNKRTTHLLGSTLFSYTYVHFGSLVQCFRPKALFLETRSTYFILSELTLHFSITSCELLPNSKSRCSCRARSAK